MEPTTETTKNNSKAEEKDGIDRAIDLFVNNSSLIIKVAPISVGFLLFLIYFAQNNFFPSFDLFSFSSLLIAAFIIGGVVFALIIFGVAAPGWFWFDTFFNDKDISVAFKKHINSKITLPTDPRKKSRYRATKKQKETLKLRRARELFKILFLIYVLPSLLCALLFFYSMATSLKGIPLFLGTIAFPAAISLFAGHRTQRNYKLNDFSWFKYALVSFFSFILVNIGSLIFAISMTEVHFSEESENIQITAATGAIIFGVFIGFVGAFGSILHARYTIFFSALFAILISLMLGIWEKLPGGIMRQLGIGNYEASHVQINPSFCSTLRVPKDYGLGGDCSMKNVKIVWSSGELYKFEITLSEKSKKTLRIPSTEILAIIETSSAPKEKP